MEVKINRINFKKAGCIFITIALMVLIRGRESAFEADKFPFLVGSEKKWPHRLAAEVVALSRLKHGFESRWGYH